MTTKLFPVIIIAALAIAGLIWLIAKRQAPPVPLAEVPGLTASAPTQDLAASSTINSSVRPRRSANTSTQDLSLLTLTVGSNVFIYLTDSAGRRSGSDLPAHQPLEEIPRSVYFQDVLADDVTGQPSDEVARSINVRQPAEGAYQITLVGAQTGEYELSVRAFSRNGTAQPSILQKGQIVQGSNVKFILNFTALPGSVSTIAQMAD